MMPDSKKKHLDPLRQNLMAPFHPTVNQYCNLNNKIIALNETSCELESVWR